MIGYWFSRRDGTTEHLDDPAAIGKTHVFEGEPVPCERGLHWSPTPWDALLYAVGPMLWEVEGEGGVPHGARIPPPPDKYAGTKRTYLRCADLTRVCRRFAAEQALSVVHLWDAPAIVREYLIDEAAGKDRSDIRAAAWEAAAWVAVAWTPVWKTAAKLAAAAAWNAALDAVWTSTREAARDALDAVWEPAKATAQVAVYEAAWAAMGQRFNELALAALDAAEICKENRQDHEST